MKNLFFLLLIALCSLFIANCGDTTNPITNNPPAPDSTVLLGTPANNTVLTSSAGTVDFNWNRTLNSASYELCVSTSAGSPDCGVYNPIISDSTSSMAGATSGTYDFYWKVRIHNSVHPCPTWSEVRHLTVIVP